ncbi:uncharacterized protein LOC120212264 [Hibiscus syriacus]|uniref:uncharacterized protein LOC120212264 n=1 Tax=Hibiscus syriacus TaxID=106335 RepID=UPI00192445C3|nr:uncharacterized protein LOC120212264 [Hibiscus syriacus]
MSPFKLVYGKACLLLVELEHKEYLAIKQLNFDAKLVREQRLLELNEMEDFRAQAMKMLEYTRRKPRSSFEVHYVYPHRVVDIKNIDDETIFKVNGQRLKAYNGVPSLHNKAVLYMHDAEVCPTENQISMPRH